ncbi:MAG: hypothetical protein WC616_02820 [Candidatus Omnitrophota bacterium]
MGKKLFIFAALISASALFAFTLEAQAREHNKSGLSGYADRSVTSSTRSNDYAGQTMPGKNSISLNHIILHQREVKQDLRAINKLMKTMIQNPNPDDFNNRDLIEISTKINSGRTTLNQGVVNLKNEKLEVKQGLGVVSQDRIAIRQDLQAIRYDRKINDTNKLAQDLAKLGDDKIKLAGDKATLRNDRIEFKQATNVVRQDKLLLRDDTRTFRKDLKTAMHDPVNFNNPDLFQAITKLNDDRADFKAHLSKLNK